MVPLKIHITAFAGTGPGVLSCTRITLERFRTPRDPITIIDVDHKFASLRMAVDMGDFYMVERSNNPWTLSGYGM